MRTLLLALFASLSLAACATDEDPVVVDTDEAAILCGCTTDACIDRWVEQNLGCDVDVQFVCAGDREVDHFTACVVGNAE